MLILYEVIKQNKELFVTHLKTAFSKRYVRYPIHRILNIIRITQAKKDGIFAYGSALMFTIRVETLVV